MVNKTPSISTTGIVCSADTMKVENSLARAAIQFTKKGIWDIYDINSSIMNLTELKDGDISVYLIRKAESATEQFVNPDFF